MQSPGDGSGYYGPTLTSSSPSVHGNEPSRNSMGAIIGAMHPRSLEMPHLSSPNPFAVAGPPIPELSCTYPVPGQQNPNQLFFPPPSSISPAHMQSEIVPPDPSYIPGPFAMSPSPIPPGEWIPLPQTPPMFIPEHLGLTWPPRILQPFPSAYGPFAESRFRSVEDDQYFLDIRNVRKTSNNTRRS